ncbi:hypothetical protein [Spirillospora sp. CA-294931]|uniref:hypothetical protein n=1 Tax=Spirillospora sp. CA-294931 TaxID=3240042 RepID=UPI003D89D096
MTGEELDADARAELRTLPKDLATRVARHLVMAGRLSDEDAEASYKHARAARRLASRVGIVREAAGLAAYYAGEWSEALAELRAARRLSASEDAYLPIMADCERGLGRPERALDLVKSPEAKKLDQEGKIELRLVESGARRDLGQFDAALVTLQIPELRDRRLRPWSARLFYAYADALADAGRGPEAVDWFARAAAADRDGETDAAERYAELEGLEIFDTEAGEEPVTDGTVHTDPTDSLATSTQPEADPQAEPEPADALVPESGSDLQPAPEAEPAPEPEAELDIEAEDEDEATEDEPEPEADEAATPPGIVPATDIAFKPAPMPETEDDVPGDEGVAEAPAIFLEPTDEDD